MSKKPTVRELRSYLAARPVDELVEEIISLYTHYDAVREFYTLRLHGSYSQELLERYKGIVTNAFFPPGSRPRPAQIAVARRALTDYQKIAAAPEGIAELMIHSVDLSVAYMCTLSSFSDSLYASTDTLFAEAITYIMEHNLQAQFADRCNAILRQSHESYWNFSDRVMELSFDAFEAPEEDEAT
ncbi:hypothetical protein K2Z83_27300 [Oscillochloris sp. ZM17-4]|uniref:DUF6155 family protein n=1 Tax=Oscillochloris sp. ZM17-4 TaxID=2866714 RepID=UPI001C733B68|nr:DUF6155 family protein [Oscillochloris sp. ZM17-4]MBX0331363.1 hypothetical protein [Oscillochloris sp. ZM17-4]